MTNKKCIVETRKCAKNAFMYIGLSIETLNTRGLQAHIDDIFLDENLMNSKIIFFQEMYSNLHDKTNNFPNLIST